MFTYNTDDVYALTQVYANPHSSNVTYTPTPVKTKTPLIK